MTDNKSVMHQALDALENLELDGDYAEGFWAKRCEAIDALREAIAQPEQQTERNFCTRCGKRLAGDGIHTCTPPKDKP